MGQAWIIAYEQVLNSQLKSNFVHIVVSSFENDYESVDALLMISLETKKSWDMDKRCFYHMCPKKAYFETLVPKESGFVWLGNNKVCKVHNISTVRLKIFDNYEFLLFNVWYFPEHKHIFLSISLFDDLGYYPKVEHGVLKFSIVHRLWLNGIKYGFYILYGSTVIGHASLSGQDLYDKTKCYDIWD